MDTTDEQRSSSIFGVRARSRWTVIVVSMVVLALTAAACGSSGTSDSTGSGAQNRTNGNPGSLSATLNGSGSTFQMPFDQAAIAGFQVKAPKVMINYAGGGSGKGKQELANGVVDFAGTDSLVKDADKASFKGGHFLYFPTVAAPITVAYNLPVQELKLDAAVMARVFSLQVTRWNDAAIAELNPGVKLPDTKITVVHRSDASGTTSNFTKYLAEAAGPAWTLGNSDVVNWPAGTQAGQGNAGVAQIVQSTQGAVGYVDYSDAVNAKLALASVKNKDGEFQQPTLKGASAAVGGATVKPDLTYDPLNTPGKGVYPITSPTWIIVYADQPTRAKGEALEAFLRYVLTDGQQLAEPSSYAALPDSLRQKAVAQLDQIKVATS
jgi:phosphate transport system substrate-binding protein